jgi:peptidoglycan/LPS O-acetylase OafA/YrhL
MDGKAARQKDPLLDHPTIPAARPARAIEVVVVGAFLVGLLATSVLAGTRQRAAAPAAVITGLITVAMVVSCPVSGHHHFGAWWLAELALVLAMLAVSVAGLRETARR